MSSKVSSRWKSVSNPLFIGDLNSQALLVSRRSQRQRYRPQLEPPSVRATVAGALVVTISAVVLMVALLLSKRQVEPPPPGFIRLTGKWDCVDVVGGEYRVCNNVWGSGSGVGEQVVDVDPSSTHFKVVKTTHNSRNVAAYPFVYKGCHWGHCTRNSGFPVKVKELRAARSSWRISVERVEGTWNAAYDIWFSVKGAADPTGGAELMIWINRGGGAGPAGRKVATVEIGGITWDVYFANMSWNYIAYLAKEPLTSVDLDVKAFIDDSVSRGFIDPEWFLDAIEAGFEIWRDGSGLETFSFSANVEGS